MLKIAARPEYDQIEKCDFGGEKGPVKTDFGTEIPGAGCTRLPRLYRNWTR
ncbi:MAG: hypothetical protein O3B73_10855 [bacterium]|nr:hypothetical protein [bacterium]